MQDQQGKKIRNPCKTFIQEIQEANTCSFTIVLISTNLHFIYLVELVETIQNPNCEKSVDLCYYCSSLILIRESEKRVSDCL